MSSSQGSPEPSARSSAGIDLAVRLGLVALLAWLSLTIFRPFLGLMVTALVLAVALNPLNTKLASTLGTRPGRAATVLVALVILLLGVPAAVLAASFVEYMLGMLKTLSEGGVVIPEPKPEVAQWPVIGGKLYSFWQQVALNTAAFVSEHQEPLLQFTRRAAGALGNGLTTLLIFIGAIFIAGIMMAYAVPGTAAIHRIFVRVCGEHEGGKLHLLSVATVRSIATGVLGVAAIQALLLGIGFMLGGVPAPGLLALIVLFICIVQIPTVVLVIPVLIWLWGSGDLSMLANIGLTIYLTLGALADNVLKPLLLGRGLAVPMPVVLIGAIGGMISSGIIGLFVGAVVLAVGWQLFMSWVDRPGAAEPEQQVQDEQGDA